MGDETTAAHGELANGKRWKLMVSRKSAVPEGKGTHHILQFDGDDRPQDEIPLDERRELLGLAYVLAYRFADCVAPGRFRIEVNGPNAAHRPHFHIHIICPATDFEIRRSVDPIAAVT